MYVIPQQIFGKRVIIFFFVSINAFGLNYAKL